MKNTDLENFPHIEAVWKKEERRKLFGHTCKKCEIFMQIFQQNKDERSWFPAQDTNFAIFHPTHERISGKLVFLPFRLVWKDLDPCPHPERRQPYNVRFLPKGKEQQKQKRGQVF